MPSGSRRLGLKRGDTIAIVGSNRPRLYWSVMAAQMLGAVPVPVYADAVADEMAYRARSCRGAASRRSRTRSRSTRSCRSPIGCRSSSRSSTTSREGCATTITRRLHVDRRRHRGRPRGARPRTPTAANGSTARSPRARARTARSFSTPRAPPASPRAWCSPRRLHHRRRATRSPSTSSPSATRRSPICRSPGSATTISIMRRPWSRASASPVRRAPRPRWQDTTEIGPTFCFAPPRVFERCSPG